MIENLWLSALWISITVVVYLISVSVYKRLGNFGLLHPILVGTAMLGALLYWAEIPIPVYQQYVSVLEWLLLPATIALAVPLFNQLPLIKKQGIKLILPIFAGGLVASGISVVMFIAFGLDDKLIATVSTKSITTPLAIETTALIGGFPSLAAIIVIITGIAGAVLSPFVFNAFNIKDKGAMGIALGTSAHAIGVAQATTLSAKSTGFATLALCINGIITSVSLSILYIIWH